MAATVAASAVVVDTMAASLAVGPVAGDGWVNTSGVESRSRRNARPAREQRRMDQRALILLTFGVC